MNHFLILIGVVFFLILIRLTHGSMDQDRIKSYIAKQGGLLIDSHWIPFGPGWAGKHKDRIYEIRYLDPDGNQHHAFCKTSGWSGVYFTEDQIEKYAGNAEQDNAEQYSDDTEQETSLEEENRSLEEENRRLREELERLKSKNKWELT